MSGSTPTDGNDTLVGSNGDDFIALLAGNDSYRGWAATMQLMVAMVRIRLMVAKALTTCMAAQAMTAFLVAQGMIFWRVIGGRTPIAAVVGRIHST